jgi:CRISPR/Cas system-associated exonuclease Cas4 (RecB family)
MTEIKQKSWSYSTLNLYKQCPQKYKYVKIDKLPEKPSYHLQKGIQTHNVAEEYLLGNIKDVPPVLRKFRSEFENLRKAGALAEEAIVLNKDWKPLESDDPWKDPNAWFRAKIDARIDDFIIDFKTGRHYAEHINQAKLYANIQLLRSKADHITVEFWYVNSGDVFMYTFYRNDLEEHIKEWEDKVNIMHNDTEFKPKKNEYCKYCDFMAICPAYM